MPSPTAAPEPAAGRRCPPSTTPASIEASCPGSPTRISRASGRTASTSRAISDSDTIEVSSTITTSWGRRLPRSCANRLWLPGRQPSSRWSVEARRPSSSSRIASPTGSRAVSSWTASCRRAAALPVGAASATSGGRAPAATACSISCDDPRDGRRLAGARAAGDRPSQRAPRCAVMLVREPRGDARSSSRQLRASTVRAGVPSRPQRPAPRAVAVASASLLADGDQLARAPARRATRRPRATGSADRSTGSSDSTLAVSRIVARSTNTWPSRGARTASATASTTASSLLADQRAPAARRRGRQPPRARRSR